MLYRTIPIAERRRSTAHEVYAIPYQRSLQQSCGLAVALLAWSLYVAQHGRALAGASSALS
jgi:hypothetical protein